LVIFTMARAGRLSLLPEAPVALGPLVLPAPATVPGAPVVAPVPPATVLPVVAGWFAPLAAGAVTPPAVFVAVVPEFPPLWLFIEAWSSWLDIH
jgi:hypothetical protein